MHDPTTALRMRIARHLDDHGPTPGDRLAAALGVTTEAFWAAVCCPGFDISGRGWKVTQRGEREALSRVAEQTACV